MLVDIYCIVFLKYLCISFIFCSYYKRKYKQANKQTYQGDGRTFRGDGWLYNNDSDDGFIILYLSLDISSVY